MKKHKQLPTNYSIGNVNPKKLTKKVSALLDNAVPNTILGMLSLAEDRDNSLVFYKRWALVINNKNDYSIVDLITKEPVYSHISLLISALHIVFQLNKNKTCKDQQIYMADQAYYRCLEDIKLYKAKLNTGDLDKKILFAARLQDSVFRLEEIKTRLSKTY
jgi:hypothetical protein